MPDREGGRRGRWEVGRVEVGCTVSALVDAACMLAHVCNNIDWHEVVMLSHCSPPSSLPRP